MEDFLLLDFTHNEMKKLNKIRLHIKAFTLSDICTGDGKRITSTAWNAKISNLDNRQHGCRWPNWEGFNKGDIGLWHLALSKCYCNQREQQLDTPLGSWQNFPPQTWQWYLNTTTGVLYQRGKTWKKFLPIESRTRYKTFSIEYTPTESPSFDTLEPTTIFLTQGSIVTEGTSSVQREHQVDEEVMSYLNWLQVNEERSRSIQGLLTDIQMGTARAVSDGSYKSEFDTGTAAYRIESGDSYQYVQGTSISPGTCAQQNAYQSELVGLLAILDTLTSICTEHNLSHGRLTIGCDEISALKSAHNCTINSVNPKQKHSDILSAIAKLKDKLPTDLDFIHVKGHQDELQDYDNLD